MNKLEKEIKDYFKDAMGIELEDSPQFSDDYLYIEFGDAKFRIPYVFDRNHFEKMGKAERMLFILTVIMRMRFGE